MKNETARIGFRVKGAYLAQLKEVQELMSFNTPTEVVQYLAQRGLEAMSTVLASQRVVRRMEGMASPEQLLPLFKALGAMEDPNPKPVEKLT